jgi:hypothetical protein
VPDELKPGHFFARPPGVDTYDYTGWDESMAAEMEAALDALLTLDNLPALKQGPANAEVRDRRRLFVAIARGVVLHLRKNAGAFTVPHTGDAVLGVDIETRES